MKKILAFLVLFLVCPFVFANPDKVTGDGYEIEIYNGSAIPAVTYENGVLSVESITMEKAEIVLSHNNGYKPVFVQPKLYVKEDGGDDFVEATPYCLNKTILKEVPRPITCPPSKPLICALKEAQGKTMLIEVQVPDPDNCYNTIEEMNTAYKFKVQHFSSYQVREATYTAYDSFNDSITDEDMNFYGYSEQKNQWYNKSKYIDSNLFSWTNVSEGVFSLNSIVTSSENEEIDSVYNLGKSRGFRGLAYDGTYWYTDRNLAPGSIVRIWDKEWNEVGNITVNVPGGGMSCDYRDLELDPADPTQLMVLCSETSSGFNWFRWANLTTGQQDWSRNWTLPPGYYQAAALTNNYIIAARTAGSSWDARLFRFNKTDGSLIDNVTAPGLAGGNDFEGGWSNGTHAFFMNGHAWDQLRSYIVCPENNLSQCAETGWLPPRCEASTSGQIESTADFVVTDNWFTISWDERTAGDCYNSIDMFYGKDFKLKDLTITGYNNILFDAPYSNMVDFDFDSNPNGNIVTDRFGNIGTVFGAEYVDGYSGSAYRFDGLGGINTTYNNSMSQNFTISAWVYWDYDISGVNHFHYIVTKNDANDDGIWLYVLDNGSGVNRNKISFDVNNSWVLSNTQLTEGWHMITAVHNNQGLWLYVDGILDANVTGNILGSSLDNISLKIGYDSFYNDGYINTTLDEVRVYDYPLTSQQILDIYNANTDNLAESIDFESDLEQFISTGCTPDANQECTVPYEILFESSGGPVNIDNININMTTAFSSLKGCLDTYNNTYSCCVIDSDNYYEQLPAGSEYTMGDGTCAVRVTGDNVELDFNNAVITAYSGSSARGFYSYREANDLSLFNAEFVGFNGENYYIDGYQHINFNYENLTSVDGRANFVFGTNLNLNNFDSVDCIGLGSCVVFDRGDNFNVNDVDVTGANASVTAVFFDQMDDSTFNDFNIDAVGGDCIRTNSMGPDNVFENIDCAIDGNGVGLRNDFSGGSNNIYRNILIDGAETGAIVSGTQNTYENIIVESNTNKGFTTDINANGLIIRNIEVNGASQEGFIVNGIGNTVDNITLINTGNSTSISGFASTWSPARYNGVNYNDSTIYIDSTMTVLETITTEPQGVTTPDGTNDFDLCLINAGGFGLLTVYLDDTNNCSTLCTTYGVSCVHTVPGYWTANGAVNNYTLNQPTNVTIVSGYTAPALLNYFSVLIQSEPQFSVLGDNNLLSNIFYGTSASPIYNPLIIDSGASGNVIWRTNFVEGAPLDDGTSNTFCRNGIGNFYEETLTPHATDCGQATQTGPTQIYSGVSSYPAAWQPQDVALGTGTVTYEVFLNNVLQGDTTSRSYNIPVASLNKSASYNVTVVPWINGSRINGTNTYRIFDFTGTSPQYSTIRDNLLYVLMAFGVAVLIIAAIILLLFIYGGALDGTAVLATIAIIAVGFAVLITVLWAILTNSLV